MEQENNVKKLKSASRLLILYANGKEFLRNIVGLFNIVFWQSIYH